MKTASDGRRTHLWIQIHFSLLINAVIEAHLDFTFHSYLNTIVSFIGGGAIFVNEKGNSLRFCSQIDQCPTTNKAVRMPNLSTKTILPDFLFHASHDLS